MTKYYDLGEQSFKLEKTSSGYFNLTERVSGNEYIFMFSTEVEALREIVSFAEIDEEDYEEVQ